MEAIVVSALVVAYLVLPFALFRFILGSFIPLKELHPDEKEYLIEAALTLGAIFFFALFLVHYVPLVKSHPFALADSVQLRQADYITVLSGLHSDKVFEQEGAHFWDASQRTSLRQARFLLWYIVCVIAVALILGWMSKRYGRLQRYAWFRFFTDVYLLRHIPQWHSLLTSFLFPDKGTAVKADVLMTDNTLYRGDVGAYFVDKDGHLSGLFLVNPKRFDRSALLTEREAWGSNRSAAVFWRDIPSTKLYLVGDKIVNLNLNYESPTAPPQLIEKFLARTQTRPFTVSISAPARETSSATPPVKHKHRI